jgi:hypothetical protein
MYNLPKSQLSFLMRISTDTLPTGANLLRWKKVLSAKCSLCNSKASETLMHALQNCPFALNQERYTWRHDSVLNHIVKQLREDKYPRKIAADLPGLGVNGTRETVYPDILSTGKRPDLTLRDDESHHFHMIELTCPGDTGIDAARQRKRVRDLCLEADISGNDTEWEAKYETIEVTASGQVRRDTRSVLNRLFGARKTQKVCKKLAKIALSTSHYIFHARSSRDWCSPPLFELCPD